jgi:Fic family protein
MLRVNHTTSSRCSHPLAELKGIGSTIPNQAILINTIALQEAKSSSEIENIVTTNDALFKAFTTQSPQADTATKEVLRYREALWEAFSTGAFRSPVLSAFLHWH